MPRHGRILIYSHDSFGLGHLRRCRTIAHALVGRFPGLSVIIISGSPIVGSFDYRARVDFVRIPGVIKLRNGEYTSLQLHIDIEQTLEIRSSIIRHTAEVFDPHLFIVDKEPLGLRGEVESTLLMLRQRDTRCVLGLRDVMDEPSVLVDEWQRKGAFSALDRYYDEIWVYGLPEIFDPRTEIPGMQPFAHKLRFTGYLERRQRRSVRPLAARDLPEGPFVLVTTGGGGDGADLIDWVISAYEHDPAIPIAALLVLGPFMNLEQRLAFEARAAAIPQLRTTVFETEIEELYARARAVIAMGGYNTFCEILSFRKPALVVPRTQPRMEQALRAERAARLGLLRVLDGRGDRDPWRLARELRRVEEWPIPPARMVRRFLGGLERVVALAAPWIGRRADHKLRERAVG
jgi:predicted glycosyltransferase